MSAPRLVSGTGRSRTRMGAPVAYPEGLYALTPDTYAWMVPNGSWGETNLGLVRCGRQTVLIDTCWDLPHTREMLHHAAAVLDDAPVGCIINTHADGDHCWGNQLFADAHIVSSQACAAQIHRHTPLQLRTLQWVSPLLRQVPALGADALGRYMGSMLKPYRYAGIRVRAADQTFSGETTLDVEGVSIHLTEVGPGHTDGDCIVHLPQRRVVFTGDILFVGVTPVAWAGPVGNIVQALQRVLALDVDIIVPGHGPFATPGDLRQQIAYWDWLQAELAPLARRGLPVDEAARQCLAAPSFTRGGFAEWPAAERLFTSACTLYREWGHDTDHLPGPLGQLDHFRRQARLQPAARA